jgi:hypothetical protein
LHRRKATCDSRWSEHGRPTGRWGGEDLQRRCALDQITPEFQERSDPDPVKKRDFLKQLFVVLDEVSVKIYLAGDVELTLLSAIGVDVEGAHDVLR